jgi:hypothetical protein
MRRDDTLLTRIAVGAIIGVLNRLAASMTSLNVFQSGKTLHIAQRQRHQRLASLTYCQRSENFERIFPGGQANGTITKEPVLPN